MYVCMCISTKQHVYTFASSAPFIFKYFPETTNFHSVNTHSHINHEWVWWWQCRKKARVFFFMFMDECWRWEMRMLMLMLMISKIQLTLCAADILFDMGFFLFRRQRMSVHYFIHVALDTQPTISLLACVTLDAWEYVCKSVCTRVSYIIK